MYTFLSKLLCGFRKAHSTQHALFKLLKQWQKELENSGLVGTILMVLSEACDCLLHDLISSKFEAYGLASRRQRVKIGSAYGFWNETKRGVP